NPAGYEIRATDPGTPGQKPDPKAGKDPKDPKTPKDKDPKVVPTVPAFIPPAEVLGKSFEQWRKQIKAPDPTRREEAMKMILMFGPDKSYAALPDIIAELKKHKPPFRVDLSVCVNGTIAMSAIFLNK